jgi:hypothetical protein
VGEDRVGRKFFKIGSFNQRNNSIRNDNVYFPSLYMRGDNMKIQKLLFAFNLVLLLSACNQQTVEDPANPKVNSEFDRSANIKGIIVKVDEDKDQLLIKGSGFGLNDEGEGIIQLDTKYYSSANFKKEQEVEIWVDRQVKVVEEHNLPIISDVAKINFTLKKERD